MTEQKDMTPDSDGVLTVRIEGVEHEYRVQDGTTVEFEWEPD